MVRAALLASLLITVGADEDYIQNQEATALLQARTLKTQGLDDADVGSCAGEAGYCMDRNSMSGKCLREQPLWNFPWGYWNCERGAKYCKHSLWKYDVMKCCPGVCTDAELYQGQAPVWNGGGVGGCEASKETCTDCGGTSNWCLQKRKHWAPKHTCENSEWWCHGFIKENEPWSKDMQECCPGVCSTAADENGVCKATGCSASDEECTDCTDNSDLCLAKERNKDNDGCKWRWEHGDCNDKDEKKRDAMLKCCPGYCEAQPDPANEGKCARLGCQASDQTCTDCGQNSDKCIAKRRGDKWVCHNAKKRGYCTRDDDHKNGRSWMQDMLECCPNECGAEEITDASGNQVCGHTGCQASDQHCENCNDFSDRCMQEFKGGLGKWEFTCEKARDEGWCSMREGWDWEKRTEAMNNCCPGICKGPFPASQMIPEWAVCHQGSGHDDEPEIVNSSVDPETPADGDMD